MQGLFNVYRAEEHSSLDRHFVGAGDLKLSGKADIIRRAANHDADLSSFEQQVQIVILKSKLVDRGPIKGCK